MSEPAIPFGAKQVLGQLQRGDSIWDGERWKKVKRVPTEVIIRKTKMLYPCAMPGGPMAIRKCEVVQPSLISGDPISFD